MQGLVQFSFVVGTDGRAHELRIIQWIGFGLDENVLRAVSLWRFEPPRVDGKPARIPATAQMSFKLL